MSTHSLPPPPRRLSVADWLICTIAAIGFAFDIYELLILPPVLREAVTTLAGTEFLSAEYRAWASALFLWPAIVGGTLGLLGGYLTDLFGRRRLLTFSIFLYAFSALGAGLSTSIQMLLAFRSLTFAGVCMEFVAAIAWLAELFPNPRQREKVLGFTQAFSSVGGLLVTGALYLIKHFGDQLPAIHGGHESWRYALISGVVPALPLILIRPFLPESPAWLEKKRAGTLRRPSFLDLFRGGLARTTIVTTLMFACSYGAAFGAIQQAAQIVPGLPGMDDPGARQGAIASIQFFQEIGGLAGRVLLAFLILWFASRQALIRVFQGPGIFVVPLVFAYFATHDLNLLRVGVFLVAMLTVGQFSFWGNYLPNVYPLHLRGTGESVAANFGGRILGTCAFVLTQWLAGRNLFPEATKEANLAYAAAIVGTSVFVLGFLLSFLLPEPKESRE
jgi:MFS family permease